MSVNMKTVNERIAQYRRLANLTQTDMAEKLGIKCSTYSQMERKGIVSAERLYQMAEIFGVSPCELFNGEEPCKNNILSTQPLADNPATLVFQQPPMPEIKKEIFTVTKKEENLIKIIRNLSKPNYDKTMKFIEEIYKEDKK